jgi:histidinol-phosphate/aromatic aminotransferase/cobyric acid decarboxylase-like protein
MDQRKRLGQLEELVSEWLQKMDKLMEEQAHLKTGVAYTREEVAQIREEIAQIHEQGRVNFKLIRLENKAETHTRQLTELQKNVQRDIQDNIDLVLEEIRKLKK